MRARLIPPVLLMTAAAAAGLPGDSPEKLAVSDMGTMALGLVMCELDTTYLTTLENLDDSPVRPNPSNPNAEWRNWINDGGGALVIPVWLGRFEDDRVDLVNRPMGLEWQGPYVVYQSSRVDGDDSDYDPGTPLDPWGEPYYLYSPLGFVDPIAETITLEGYGDLFNDYTIVSYGSDGVKSGDDLFRSVGTQGVRSTVISSVRIRASSGRTSPWIMAVKGYLFGGTQGTGGVFVDGTPAGTIASWSSTLVEVEITDLPPAGSVITLRRGDGDEVSFEGFLVEGDTSVAGWELY